MDTINTTSEMPDLNAKSCTLGILVYFGFKSGLSVVFEKPYTY